MELQKFTNTTLLDTNVSFAISKGLWLNATDVAKKYGKRMDNYWRNEKEYAEKIAKLSSLNMSDLKYTVVGKGKPQGTYIHPDLVISFARYCNEYFAIACDKFIKEQIVKEKEIELQKKEELNKALAKEYIEMESKYLDKIAELESEIERLKQNGMRFAHDGSTSVTNIKTLLNVTEFTVQDINDILQWYGYLETSPKVTIKRDVPESLDGFIGYAERKYGNPHFKPEAVAKAIDAYKEAGCPEVTVTLDFIKKLEDKVKYYKEQIGL
jgi:hypothetical protein